MFLWGLSRPSALHVNDSREGVIRSTPSYVYPIEPVDAVQSKTTRGSSVSLACSGRRPSLQLAALAVEQSGGSDSHSSSVHLSEVPGKRKSNPQQLRLGQNQHRGFCVCKETISCYPSPVSRRPPQIGQMATCHISHHPHPLFLASRAQERVTAWPARLFFR